MAETTRYSWPYPELTDAPDGPALGQDLAEAVEATVGSIDDRVTGVEADLAFAEARTIGKPLCIVTKAAITSNVPNNGAVLAWDTETVDTHGMHSNVTNNSRITPGVAGWYRITFTILFAAAATGRIGPGLRKNGNITTIFGPLIANAAGSNKGATMTRTLDFNGTTDYVEAFAFQDSGAALNTADPAAVVFEVEYIRPL